MSGFRLSSERKIINALCAPDPVTKNLRIWHACIELPLAKGLPMAVAFAESAFGPSALGRRDSGRASAGRLTFGGLGRAGVGAMLAALLVAGGCGGGGETHMVDAGQDKPVTID